MAEVMVFVSRMIRLIVSLGRSVAKMPIGTCIRRAKTSWLSSLMALCTIF